MDSANGTKCYATTCLWVQLSTVTKTMTSIATYKLNLTSVAPISYVTISVI